MKRLTRLIKTIQTLGIKPAAHAAVYELTRRSSRLSRPLLENDVPPKRFEFQQLPLAGDRFAIKAILEQSASLILTEADFVRDGNFKPFWGSAINPIDFTVPGVQRPWNRISVHNNIDLKDIWEPARFCWVSRLIQAEILKPDPLYHASFYKYLRAFQEMNPPYYGENWLSAQEVAVRLIWIVIGSSVFSEKPGGLSAGQMIAEHAERIMLTRHYAIAQRNNHWLSESAGLITAACVLPGHPRSQRWLKRGWDDFQTALSDQILPDGAYIQHSANYHRLMLQLVIWVDFLIRIKGMDWPPRLREKIARSIEWLSKISDEKSGAVWNLGHNDGAFLFPLGGDIPDYRPTLQAASIIFTGHPLYPAGKWDELALWFNLAPRSAHPKRKMREQTFLDLTVPTLSKNADKAILRVAACNGRPAHADQLHTAIWHGAKHLALDPGTFRYTAEPPWENGLKSARVHNGPVIDKTEPMTDLSKFLWSDWDHARLLTLEADHMAAERFGYQKIGVRQVRTVKMSAVGWLVIDDLSAANQQTAEHEHNAEINWLLPDSAFQIDPEARSVKTEAFELRFSSNMNPVQLSVFRCGQLIESTQSDKEDNSYKIYGWYSPTYGELTPALSVVLRVRGKLPMQITTEWIIKGFGGEK